MRHDTEAGLPESSAGSCPLTRIIDGNLHPKNASAPPDIFFLISDIKCAQ